MTRTKLTAAQIATGYVSSSLNNVVTLSSSNSSTVVYSGNNNSITLTAGTYLITAGATIKIVLSGQDSTFGVDVNDGTSSVLSFSQSTMGATSGTHWPFVPAQGVITLTSQKTLTVRCSQSFGTGATISDVATFIHFTKTG